MGLSIVFPLASAEKELRGLLANWLKIMERH